MTYLGTTDFYQRVAKGLVPGHSFIEKYGENFDIDSAFEVIWDGGASYVPPTQARIHDVASTVAADAGTVVSSGNATGGSSTTIEDTGATFITDGVAVGDLILNDTNTEIGLVVAVTSETVLTHNKMRSAEDGIVASDFANTDAYRIVTNASTGASMFFVRGQDTTRAMVREFVVLNGTNNVATSLPYVRQYRASVFGPGTTGATGTITSTAQTDGTVSCQIVNGNNQSLMAIFSIESGKVGYLVNWWASLSKKQAAASVVRLRAGQLDGISYIIQPRSLNSTGSSEYERQFKIPLPLGEGADVFIEADSDTANVGISAGFLIMLVDADLVE